MFFAAGRAPAGKEVEDNCLIAQQIFIRQARLLFMQWHKSKIWRRLFVEREGRLSRV